MSVPVISLIYVYLKLLLVDKKTNTELFS